jgi:hypothetical protein
MVNVIGAFILGAVLMALSLGGYLTYCNPNLKWKK